MQKVSHAEKTLEERQNESNIMLKHYPGRCCIYIEKSNTCKNLDDLTKKKFLVPNTLTCDQLMYLIRSKLILKKEEALFFFIGKKMMTGRIPMGDLHKKYSADDNFLYIKYASENCFG